MFRSKHMVETPRQVQIGLEHGAFKEGEYVCLQNNTYRICAPPDETEMSACIFWTKSSSSDMTPTWDKVVSLFFQIFMLQAINRFQFGGIVYNLNTLDKRFSEDNEVMSSYMKMFVTTIL